MACGLSYRETKSVGMFSMRTKPNTAVILVPYVYIWNCPLPPGALSLLATSTLTKNVLSFGTKCPCYSLVLAALIAHWW